MVLADDSHIIEFDEDENMFSYPTKNKIKSHKEIPHTKKTHEKKKKSKSIDSNKVMKSGAHPAVANYNWLHNQFFASKCQIDEPNVDIDNSYGESESLLHSEYNFATATVGKIPSSFSVVTIGWIQLFLCTAALIYGMWQMGGERVWSILATCGLLMLISVQNIRTGLNMSYMNMKVYRTMSLINIPIAIGLTGLNAFSLYQLSCESGNTVSFTTVILTCISRNIMFGALIFTGVLLPLFATIFAYGTTSPYLREIDSQTAAAQSSSMTSFSPVTKTSSWDFQSIPAMSVDTNWSRQEQSVTITAPTPPPKPAMTSGQLRQQQKL